MEWFEQLTPEQAREWVRMHATASNPHAISINETQTPIMTTPLNKAVARMTGGNIQPEQDGTPSDQADGTPDMATTYTGGGGHETHYEDIKRDMNIINTHIGDMRARGYPEDHPELDNLKRAYEVHKRRLNNLNVRTY